ncbi:phospholipase A2 inhibitor and Ly6/PLAUR domain-containing protein-like isoform X2 [Pleurodeles waltl]|uniref:phospholipase A2 inhibitor and Ly6/PLAUR domain-containing protein-like isoform X2 n=1 Tax=Pleurodeles waltl TaxID=8319 RepID=UPI00370987C5
MYKTPRRMQTLHHPTPYSFSTMRAILAAVTMLQALINGGTDVILSVFKDCLSPSQKPDCGREFSFKTPTAFFRISRTCCDSDFCNAGDVQVPAVDETPNGYKCEECFIYQSTDECSPTGEVQCTGKQNTCGSLSGTILRPGEAGRQYSFKGCTTRDFCKLGIFNMAGSQAYNYRLKCSPALEP